MSAAVKARLEETLEEREAIEVSAMRTRVSLREIRELSFRALVANGASPGEAMLAAAQVLTAELVAGTGLEAVIADVEAGRWQRAGLDLRAQPPLLLASGERSGLPLRSAGLLADLAVADPGVWVVAPALGGADLVDAAALRASKDGRSTLIVGDGDRCPLVVGPDGTTGRAASPGLEPPGCSGPGTWLRVPPAPVPTEPGADERWSAVPRLRREAAASGVLVEAALWARIEHLGHGYLVPER